VRGCLGHAVGLVASLAVLTGLPVVFYSLGVFAALATRADTGSALNVLLVPAVAFFVAVLLSLSFAALSFLLLRARQRRSFPVGLPLLAAPFLAFPPSAAFGWAMGAGALSRLTALGVVYLVCGFAAYWVPLNWLGPRKAPPAAGSGSS
jgi:hypothetical protein